MFRDKTVWITGASSGIGAALAQVFAAQGATVVLSARCLIQLEQVRSRLSNAERHLIIELDITDEQRVVSVVPQVFAQVGKIDLLINNAGISQRALIAETTMQTERKIMEVDYFAQVLLTKTVLPYLVKQGQGHLVFVSSIAGLIGTQYRASYSAAKAALHLWANSCRAEYASQGLTVSVIFPGFVQTKVSFNALNGNGEAQQHQDEAIANGLNADDFAQQVVKALHAKREYIVIGGAKERLGVMLAKWHPALLYKMIRKTSVK